MDDYPGGGSPAFQRYLELDARRLASPDAADTAEGAALLNEMGRVWPELDAAEQEWLEYRSLRRAAAERGDNVARKLSQIWKDAEARDAARRELARYEETEAEVERVQLAALKLCEGDLGRLAVVVTAAQRDYRSILRQAEHPIEPYWNWLRL